MIDARLMEAIKEDADLLTKSDKWLQEEKNCYIGQLQTIIDELKPIMLALVIKQKLQQKNIVPQQKIMRDKDGNINDVVIEFCKLHEALNSIINAKSDQYDQLIAADNIATWHNDGYDVEICLNMKYEGQN
jgi:hypothetical protein